MSSPHTYAGIEPEAGINPFPGLRPFEPDEDYLFFGRERQTDELLRKLRTTRFLAILGRSGSGKSSLVRSGLIPTLYGGGMTRAGSRWRVAIMRPGEDPLGNLAAALSSPEALGNGSADAGLTQAFFETTLRASRLGLVECIRQSHIPAADNVLILVDQFEEIFRYKRSRRIVGRDEAVAFVKLLLAARAGDVPCYIAITMRSDFIGDCMEFGTLPEVINDGIYLVPRMTRDELRSAITGPVAVGGGTIAPRLISRLLNDVGDDPDQLPILQHALMRTWEWWEGDHEPGEPLDLRHYEAIGTMHEALSRHAEECFAELDGRGQAIAEKLFKALTDKASDARGVRRPAPVSEICALTGASLDDVTGVVETFRKAGRSFLMPPAGVLLRAGSILDVSHESLMRIWERLSRWADEEAQAGQLYLNVARAAQRHEEGVAALWRDPELQLALTWRENEHPTAEWAERYDPSFARTMAFLDASKTDRDLEVQERELRRRQALRQARIIIAILAAASLLTLALGGFAFRQKSVAERAENKAESAFLRVQREQKRAEIERTRAEQEAQRAQEARANAEKQRVNAVQQSQIAQEQTTIAQSQRQRAESESQKALNNEREARAQKNQADIARREAVADKKVAEDERTKAQTSEKTTRRLSHLAAARALALAVPQLKDPATSALLALEGYRLNRENGGEPEDPELFTAMRTARERLHADIVLRQPDSILSLAVAPDGRSAVAGGENGQVVQLNLERDAKPSVIGNVASPVRALAMRSAGDFVAAGTEGGRIAILDLRNVNAPPRKLAAGTAAVSSLAFQPAGSLLAAGSLDGSVTLWDVTHPAAPTTLLEKSANRIRAVVFSADGKTLAAGRQSGGALLWDVARPATAPRTACASMADIRSVAFEPDGKALACGGQRGQIVTAPLAGGTAVVLAGHSSSVNALGFSPRGNALVSASSDGTLHILDMSRPGDPAIVVPGHESWVWAASFTHDGNRVVSGGADRTVRVWPARTEVLAADLCRAVERSPSSKQSLSKEEWIRYMPPDEVYRDGRPCRELPKQETQ